MKVAFIGDIHGDHRSAYRSVQSVVVDGNAERVFFVGDFGWDFSDKFLDAMSSIGSEFNVNIEFIDGNHEDFNRLYSFPIENGYRALRDNVLHIPRGTVMNIGGHNVLFIGGASSIDKAYRKEGESWWPQELITDHDITTAMHNVGDKDITVVVSHEAPFLPYGRSDDFLPLEVAAVSQSQREKLQYILNQTQPSLWYHGHHHIRYTDTRDNCKIRGLGHDADPVSERTIVVDTNSWARTKEMFEIERILFS